MLVLYFPELCSLEFTASTVWIWANRSSQPHIQWFKPKKSEPACVSAQTRIEMII